MNRKSAKYISMMAMMITMALILSYIETLIPAIPIPGAKIGLPNIVTLLALLTLGFTDAFVILIVRSTVSAMLFSGVMSLAYSLAGGVLSLTVMFLLTRLYKEEIGLSIIFVSIMGAITHNVGQLLVGVVVVEHMAIFSLLPMLALIALLTGFVVGFCVYIIYKPFNLVLNKGRR